MKRILDKIGKLGNSVLSHLHQCDTCSPELFAGLKEVSSVGPKICAVFGDDHFSVGSVKSRQKFSAFKIIRNVFGHMKITARDIIYICPGGEHFTS